MTLASADPREVPNAARPAYRPWHTAALRLRYVAETAGLPYNVYDVPPQGAMAAPCYIVAPGDPWIIEGDEKTPMQHHREQYLITAVAPASDPDGAINTLYDMAALVMAGFDQRGWWWIGVSGPIRIDSGGVQYLGVTIRAGHSVDNTMLPVIPPG